MPDEPVMVYIKEPGGRMIATVDYVRDVEQALTITDRGLAQRVADFVINEIDRVGSQSAVMYFDSDGCGPLCSWCGGAAGLCGHVMRNGTKPSRSNNENGEQAAS